jgi:hypothetical protein
LRALGLLGGFGFFAVRAGAMLTGVLLTMAGFAVWCGSFGPSSVCGVRIAFALEKPPGEATRGIAITLGAAVACTRE